MVPKLIQGGLGVAISCWGLARAVAQMGQLGVVAGTGLNGILARRLMDGDPDGLMRRVLANMPLTEAVQAVLDHYYIPGGKGAGKPYRSVPMHSITPAKILDQLTVLGTYVEITLAKEGHDGLIGMNLLEKGQMPIIAALYGAMLAGVDYIVMGAGVPMQVAVILDKLANHEPVSYRLDVHGALPEDDYRIHLDPEALLPGVGKLFGQLKRPKFLPIISAVVLAQALLKRSGSVIDGFVIEGPTAGGHNAPPRGPLTINDRGEPIYGPRDVVDLEKMKTLGVPFWLAGGYGNAAQVQHAIELGAAGVQVGTAFHLCEESAIESNLKARMLRWVLDGKADVLTSPTASPTGFPFKVALVPGTISDPDLYAIRPRICDLGFLRTAYKKEDGSVGYRCAAEPVADYVRKGGVEADTVGRTCLCNHLLATAGFPQVQKGGYLELPSVTSGDDLVNLAQFIKPGHTTYTAADVVHQLLGE
ncbi:MAG: nitronate monooxygenase [Anaerolineae bacterium]